MCGSTLIYAGMLGTLTCIPGCDPTESRSQLDRPWPRPSLRLERFSEAQSSHSGYSYSGYFYSGYSYSYSGHSYSDYSYCGNYYSGYFYLVSSYLLRLFLTTTTLTPATPLYFLYSPVTESLSTILGSLA